MDSTIYARRQLHARVSRLPPLNLNGALEAHIAFPKCAWRDSLKNLAVERHGHDGDNLRHGVLRSRDGDCVQGKRFSGRRPQRSVGHSSEISKQNGGQVWCADFRTSPSSRIVRPTARLTLRATAPSAQRVLDEVRCPPGHDTIASFSTRAPASFKRWLGGWPK